MEKELRDAFAAHVVYQCRHIIRARDEVWNSPTPVEVYGGMQSALTAAAIAARILWGGKGKWSRDADHKELREWLGVKDDSPLRNTLVRDHFEHIESRIEQWWEQRHADDAPTGFGGFEFQSGEISFWNDRVNLYALADEAERIKNHFETLRELRNLLPG
jgi:hypothetical protein